MLAVIDASYLIEFLTNARDERFKWLIESRLIAPDLLRYEYNNFFVRNINKLVGLMDMRQTIYDLAIESIDITGKEEYICELASSHALTFYDACYFVIALEKQLPIATYDREIIRVAEEFHIQVIP